MPLTRLKEEYLEQDGVRFLMEDESGSTVACRGTGSEFCSRIQTGLLKSRSIRGVKRFHDPRQIRLTCHGLRRH